MGGNIAPLLLLSALLMVRGYANYGRDAHATGKAGNRAGIGSPRFRTGCRRFHQAGNRMVKNSPEAGELLGPVVLSGIGVGFIVMGGGSNSSLATRNSCSAFSASRRLSLLAFLVGWSLRLHPSWLTGTFPGPVFGFG